MPEGKISPSLMVIKGLIPSRELAIPATFPILPPALRYSTSPTVKKYGLFS